VDRREFISGAALGLLTAPFAAAAPVPRIGVLAASSPQSPAADAFRQGLRELGYVEGRSIVIEWRTAGAETEHLPKLAAELVRLNVMVIVASNSPAVAAAQKTTKTIPIVMVMVPDPVRVGFIASLPRPAGNITGLSSRLMADPGVATLIGAVAVGALAQSGKSPLIGKLEHRRDKGPIERTPLLRPPALRRGLNTGRPVLPFRPRYSTFTLAQAAPSPYLRRVDLRHVAVIALILGLTGGALTAGAQPVKKAPRIGVLSPPEPLTAIDVFRRGLQELGYTESTGTRLEYRSSEGHDDRFPALAADLVSLNVGVIVAATPPAIRAAQRATTSIPIVMVLSGDPVRSGLIKSLARPGGNTTGVATLTYDLSPKRLELFKECVPHVRDIAVLVNPVYPGVREALSEMVAAGPRLGLRVHVFEVREATDFDRAFTDILRARADGLVGRKVMEDEIDGSPILPARRLPGDGLEAWELVKARGYEGLVAKDERAPYGPSTRWWKVKVRHEARFVVGGIARSESGYVGLLVGRRAGRRLRYLGTVEWGVGRHVLEDLIERRGARPRDSSPFADFRRRSGVIWLEPTLRAEISFAEIVGERFRAPVFRRFV
jgi:ABC-type uncharacterized transport system substrate-binding protein